MHCCLSYLKKKKEKLKVQLPSFIAVHIPQKEDNTKQLNIPFLFRVTRRKPLWSHQYQNKAEVSVLSWLNFRERGIHSTDDHT